MIITYHGMQSFKVQFGDTVLAFDPVSKDSDLTKGKSNLKIPNFGADITLVSLNDPNMNGVEQTSRGDKESFVINGPGEYEVQNIFIKGVSSVSNYKRDNRINTIYNINLESMNLCFLGALGAENISSEAKESMSNVDILFVPIGGDGVLNSASAYKLAVSLEPSIIIPMHYSFNNLEIGESDALKNFMKEAGVSGLKSIDKLTIKKKDLEGKEAEVVILSAE